MQYRARFLYTLSAQRCPSPAPTCSPPMTTRLSPAISTSTLVLCPRTASVCHCSRRCTCKGGGEEGIQVMRKGRVCDRRLPGAAGVPHIVASSSQTVHPTYPQSTAHINTHLQLRHFLLRRAALLPPPPRLAQRHPHVHRVFALWQPGRHTLTTRQDSAAHTMDAHPAEHSVHGALAPTPPTLPSHTRPPPTLMWEQWMVAWPSMRVSRRKPPRASCSATARVASEGSTRWNTCRTDPSHLRCACAAMCASVEGGGVGGTGLRSRGGVTHGHTRL